MRTNVGDYSSAIRQAEKVIGYPTSFLNLRWIINDEIANIATHFKKLLATKHPILKSARQLLLTSGLPSWGLIVLLTSKMVNNREASRTTNDLHDSRSGILHSQRVLAEVVEMLRTSNVIHKGIMTSRTKTAEDDGILFGNKMSILGGDYLLAKSFKELALLRDSHLHELMSSGVRDMTEAQFLGIRDANNNPLPSKPNRNQEDIEIPKCFGPTLIDSRNVLGHMRSEWTLRTVLDGGHLLARACQCTLHLGGQREELQKLGYEVGRSFALFSQAHEDLKALGDDKFSLVCAPVMLQLEDEPDLHEKLAVKGEVAYDEIREAVRRGNGAEKALELKEACFKQTVDVLQEFPDSEAREALTDILVNINNFN